MPGNQGRAHPRGQLAILLTAAGSAALQPPPSAGNAGVASGVIEGRALDHPYEPWIVLVRLSRPSQTEPSYKPRSWLAMPAVADQDCNADVAATNLPFALARSPFAAAAFRSEIAPLTLLKSCTGLATLATSSTHAPLHSNTTACVETIGTVPAAAACGARSDERGSRPKARSHCCKLLAPVHADVQSLLSISWRQPAKLR